MMAIITRDAALEFSLIFLCDIVSLIMLSSGWSY